MQDPRNKRRDGWGGWDSLGERALAIQVVEAAVDEQDLAERRFASWQRRQGMATLSPLAIDPDSVGPELTEWLSRPVADLRDQGSDAGTPGTIEPSRP